MASVLVTGANRGIGAALCQQWAQAGYRVFAAMRHPEQTPNLGPNISPVALDLSHPESPYQLARTLKNEPLEVLWCNAGLYGLEAARLGEIDAQTWAEVMQVNALGPLLLAEAFEPHLARGEQKKLIATSSTMGSLSENSSGSSYAYRASKAALNMTFVSLAQDLGPKGIICTLFCPGWVRTAMGGVGAPLSAEDSARQMVEVVQRLGPQHNGQFLNRSGEPIAW